jgi:hypothetical protein
MIRTIFAATAIAATTFGAPSPAAAQPAAPTPTSPASEPTAICNDGTPSYSQHRSGTCSHHGGVKQWCPCDSTSGQSNVRSEIEKYLPGDAAVLGEGVATAHAVPVHDGDQGVDHLVQI